MSEDIEDRTATGCGEAGHGGAGRGGIVEPLVLAVLARGKSHGYDIRQAIVELTDGRKQCDIGGLYRLLRRFEDEGFVTSSWQEPDAGARRREYSITSEGRELAEGWIPQLRERSAMNALVADLLTEAMGGGER